MTLAGGLRLGPYEILSPLGAGGMGEVYRARDARLGRDVAVKVVHPRLAGDPERLLRFEKEARAAAQVGHPNILIVHDVGSHEGSPYIVSELLEGESLREKLGAPLPPKKAVDYANQIAQGLAAAHEKGIVHRDLKPENVFVTKEGHVKILDFGIAKLTQPAIPSVSLTEAATAAPSTDAGVVLGTVFYMSPEQARGEAVDFRSDQFSLGVVLYEMLTGRRPFRGASAAETLAAIIREEPAPVTKLDPKLPAILGWIVERCLSKDQEERYSSTRDLAKELQSLRTHLSEAVSAADVRVVEAPRLRRRVSVWALAAVAALAVALGLLVGTRILRPGSRTAPAKSLTLSFPVDAALYTGNTNSLALSPDGRTLVYAGWKGGQTHLFVRSIDRDETKEMPETDGAHVPFFSPDGQWVGFFAEQKLKKVALAGGSPVALCDVGSVRGGSWGSDDTIVFVPAPKAGLHRIPASGGEPKKVTAADAAEGEFHYHPDVLPDGEKVLFQIVHPDRRSRVAVLSLRTGEQRVILEDAAYPRYLPTRHLLFTRAGILYAVPFDLQRLETAGPPVPLLHDLLTNRYGTQYGELACSREGTLVYVPYRLPQRALVWVDRKGAIEKLPFPPGGYSQVALSSDGGRLAAVSVGKSEEQSLVIGDLARGTLTRSAAEGKFLDLAWTPDGKRVAFGFAPEGKRMWQVFWQSADGSAPPERLGSETADQQESPTSFSPDGAALLVQVINYSRTSSWEILLLPLSGDRKLRDLFRTRLGVRDAHLSPDGRWVAYYSDESGRHEVYVQPYPGPGPKWQISTEGGRYPRWSRNGRALFYQHGDKMMAVEVETKPTFRAGRPWMLFEGSYFNDLFWETDNYDVATDGSRFLMIKPDPAESGPAHVKVVLNWFEEVKRRVPAGR